MAPLRSYQSHFSRLAVLSGMSLTLLAVHANAAPATGTAVYTPSPAGTGTAAPNGAPPPRILTAPPTTPFDPNRSKAILQADLAYKVCLLPLSLTVQGASLEDIAANVEKALPSKTTPKLTVQVRNAKAIHLSFAAKDSTVGEVLRSSGSLAGVYLWAFSDHLLLAPREALTTDELASVTAGTAMYVSGLGTPYSIFRDQQKELAPFVANEIKEGKTTFNQLSPDAQAMVEILFGFTHEVMQARPTSVGIPQGVLDMNLASNPTLNFNAQNGGMRGSVQLNFPNQGTMGWSTDGRSMNYGVFTTKPNASPSSSDKPPFVDPSAGKS